MKQKNQNVASVIAFVEAHLEEKLSLDTIAQTTHYSKYYLHRMFMDTIGMSIHDYVLRRRLTEAAKLLVFSERPVLDIALSAGYESQQAFTLAFKEMYKKTPAQFRNDETFYPLLLRFQVNTETIPENNEIEWKQQIRYAQLEDMTAWMKLVHLVVDGFPYLNEEDYTEQLKSCINKRQALILMDLDTAIGVMAFCKETGSIDFFGVHPQYRGQGIEQAFFQYLIDKLHRNEISITTFRKGDKADRGYRDALMDFGFAEDSLLMEYGYPTQRLVYRSGNGVEKDG